VFVLAEAFYTASWGLVAPEFRVQTFDLFYAELDNYLRVQSQYSGFAAYLASIEFGWGWLFY